MKGKEKTMRSQNIENTALLFCQHPSRLVLLLLTVTASSPFAHHLYVNNRGQQAGWKVFICLFEILCVECCEKR